MKPILFSVVAASMALSTAGCASSTASDRTSAVSMSDHRLLDPAEHADSCPVCGMKWVRAGQNEKGHPNWKRVHVCPECKVEVVTVMKNGKWCHECVTGPTSMSCKTCNPK